MSPSTSDPRPPPRGSCDFLCIVPEHVQVNTCIYCPSLHKEEHKYSIQWRMYPICFLIFFFTEQSILVLTIYQNIQSYHMLFFFFFLSHFQRAFIISYTMIQDPRVGITMYPGPPSPPWGEGQRTEEVGWSQFRSSQETCLLPGDRPKLTPRMWGRGTCTHAGTIRTRRRHPLQRSLPSHSGGSPGSSASSSWSGSGWGSGCQKEQTVSS